MDFLALSHCLNMWKITKFQHRAQCSDGQIIIWNNYFGLHSFSTNSVYNLGLYWLVLDRFGHFLTILDGLGHSWMILYNLEGSWTVLESERLVYVVQDGS